MQALKLYFTSSTCVGVVRFGDSPTGAGSRPAIPVHWLSWFSNGSLPLSATVPFHSGSGGVGDRDLARSGKSTCGIFLF